MPLNQRLSTCALVSHKFKAAAVAATDRIQAIFSEQPAVDSLATYLQQHGSHLTSLDLSAEWHSNDHDLPWFDLEQLPCKRLQELHLLLFNLGSGPDDEERPSVLNDATAITRLQLQHANFDPAALSLLPSLQHLSLSGFEPPDSPGWTAGDEYAIAFSSLQQLTHLGLTSLTLEAESVCQISSITGLEHPPFCVLL